MLRRKIHAISGICILVIIFLLPLDYYDTPQKAFKKVGNYVNNENYKIVEVIYLHDEPILFGYNAINDNFCMVQFKSISLLGKVGYQYQAMEYTRIEVVCEQKANTIYSIRNLTKKIGEYGLIPLASYNGKLVVDGHTVNVNKVIIGGKQYVLWYIAQ